MEGVEKRQRCAHHCCAAPNWPSPIESEICALAGITAIGSFLSNFCSWTNFKVDKGERSPRRSEQAFLAIVKHSLTDASPALFPRVRFRGRQVLGHCSIHCSCRDLPLLSGALRLSAESCSLLYVWYRHAACHTAS